MTDGRHSFETLVLLVSPEQLHDALALLVQDPTKLDLVVTHSWTTNDPMRQLFRRAMRWALSHPTEAQELLPSGFALFQTRPPKGSTT